MEERKSGLKMRLQSGVRNRGQYRIKGGLMKNCQVSPQDKFKHQRHLVFFYLGHIFEMKSHRRTFTEIG